MSAPPAEPPPGSPGPTGTTAGGGRYRRPDAPPTADDVRQREAWNSYVAASLASAQSSADKWRTGLAGFVSLVTAGLLIKGPESAADIETTWRAGLTVLLGGGLIAAIVGLWMALRAAAGDVEQASLEQVVAKYGSLDGMQVALAGKAVASLRIARIAVGVSLVLLVAGLLTWWWAPKPAASPAAYLQVDTTAKSYCGELSSADGHTVVLKISGQREPQPLKFDDITNMHVVDHCQN